MCTRIRIFNVTELMISKSLFANFPRKNMANKSERIILQRSSVVCIATG
jgi:hypothetical protein